LTAFDDPEFVAAPRAWRVCYRAYAERVLSWEDEDAEPLRGRPFDAEWRALWLAEFGAVEDQLEEIAGLAELLEQRQAEDAREDEWDEVTLVEAVQGRDIRRPDDPPLPHRVRAHKIHRWGYHGVLECDDYQVGGYIRSVSRPVRGLVDLFDALTKLEDAPRWFIIRGRARDGVDTRRPHGRRSITRQGREAFYEEADRRWVMIDVDAVEWPEGLREGDGDGAAAWLRSKLPPCFARAGCVWQWSQSAGVGGWTHVKMHLWFWLDRPACNPSWRRWMKANADGVIDRAPMTPVQPHYTANPLFIDVEDPVDTRTGILLGAPVKVPREVVALERWEAMEAAEKKRRREAARAARKARGALSNQRGYARAALRSACEKILAAGEGVRHVTIRDESLAVHRFVVSGELDEHEWRDELGEAARAVLPFNRWGEVERLLGGAADVDDSSIGRAS
jgi:hypothetical protein